MAIRPKIWAVLALILGLTIAATVRPIYVWGIVYGLWQPLKRPASVSKTAHYVSWIEDGNWFDCSVDRRRNVDVCKAWDADGRLLADGDFRLEGEDRAATESELRPSNVTSSEGRTYAIYLFGEQGARSKMLVPVKRNAEN
jgi:hypothetical protein